MAQLQEIRDEITARIEASQDEREKRVLQFTLKSIVVHTVNGYIDFAIRVPRHHDFSLRYNAPMGCCGATIGSANETALHERDDEVKRLCEDAQTAVIALNEAIRKANNEEKAIKEEAITELTTILKRLGQGRNQPQDHLERYQIKGKRVVEQNDKPKRRKASE